jgi:hypothetical protein
MSLSVTRPHSYDSRLQTTPALWLRALEWFCPSPSWLVLAARRRRWLSVVRLLELASKASDFARRLDKSRPWPIRALSRACAETPLLRGAGVDVSRLSRAGCLVYWAVGAKSAIEGLLKNARLLGALANRVPLLILRTRAEKPIRALSSANHEAVATEILHPAEPVHSTALTPPSPRRGWIFRLRRNPHSVVSATFDGIMRRDCNQRLEFCECVLPSLGRAGVRASCNSLLVTTYEPRNTAQSGNRQKESKTSCLLVAWARSCCCSPS